MGAHKQFLKSYLFSRSKINKIWLFHEGNKKVFFIGIFKFLNKCTSASNLIYVYTGY